MLIVILQSGDCMSGKANSYPDNRFNINKETVGEYFEDNGPFGVAGYIDATQNSVDAINSILQRCKNFKELKKQLTTHILEREKFLDSFDLETWVLKPDSKWPTYDEFLERSKSGMFP